MGCRSSCQIFEAFSTAVQWMATHHAGVAGMIHILDDFLIISVSGQRGKRDLKHFKTLCKILGVPLAPEKTGGPASGKLAYQ